MRQPLVGYIINRSKLFTPNDSIAQVRLHQSPLFVLCKALYTTLAS
jgi:hypothetical protein